MRILATTVPIATIVMMTVAIALTLGFRPRRAREKITSGMVVEPGPDRKAASTTNDEAEPVWLSEDIAALHSNAVNSPVIACL